MGATKSKNVTDTITTSIVTALTEVTQEAGGDYQSINSADFEDCDFGKNFNLNQKNVLKVNHDITQKIANSTEIQNKLDEKIKQAAKAEMEGLGFLSFAETENIMKKVTNLKTSITQRISAE